MGRRQEVINIHIVVRRVDAVEADRWTRQITAGRENVQIGADKAGMPFNGVRDATPGRVGEQCVGIGEPERGSVAVRLPELDWRRLVIRHRHDHGVAEDEVAAVEEGAGMFGVPVAVVDLETDADALAGGFVEEGAELFVGLDRPAVILNRI